MSNSPSSKQVEPPPPPKPRWKPAPGEKIGNYKLVKQLGKGGMGEVWQALDLPLKRYVAIKFNLGEHQDEPEVIARFRSEGVLATRITHPSLVNMHATGQTDAGVLYHVMELVEGESLHRRIQPTPEKALKFDHSLAMDICWQVAVVLAPLHGKGIVHRDLKPGNLMLVDEETMPHLVRVKLIDFGIAKLTDKSASKELELEVHTTKGFHPGSPHVMPPEQWKAGARQGPEIDVYALGCILFRLVSGKWPFVGDYEVGHQLLDAPLLTEEDKEVKPELALLVARMLAKDPAERPTMAEVRDELARQLGVKTAVAGQVVIRPTMEISAVHAELATGDTNTSDAVVEVASASRSLDARTSTKNGQQVPAPTAMSTRRRSRLYLSVVGGAASLLAVATLAMQAFRVPRPTAATAMIEPPRAVPVVSPAASADLGTAQVPATVAAPVVPSGGEPHAPAKKHRKKKKDIVVVSDDG